MCVCVPGNTVLSSEASIFTLSLTHLFSSSTNMDQQPGVQTMRLIIETTWHELICYVLMAFDYIVTDLAGDRKESETVSWAPLLLLLVFLFAAHSLPLPFAVPAISLLMTHIGFLFLSSILSRISGARRPPNNAHPSRRVVAAKTTPLSFVDRLSVLLA